MGDARNNPLQQYEGAGVIDDEGRLQMHDLAGFRRAMQRFGRGLEVTVRVEEFRSRRSSQANRYYFGAVLREISEHTGYEVDELHEYFKKKFNPVTFSMGSDEEVIGGSTRKLNTNQFYEYVERIRRFAETELGVSTPDPDRRVA